MKNTITYVLPRPFSGYNIPLAVQNTYIREYVANSNKKSYIVYEDLFSNDLDVFNQTVDSLGLDIDKKKLRDKIHPSKKYRKEVKLKTIL